MQKFVILVGLLKLKKMKQEIHFVVHMNIWLWKFIVVSNKLKKLMYGH